ncbi:hypothetical protein EpJSE_00050 [Escherichia phage JSE]|uniref:Uncharacterized protein n=1 Tax=Escherichia phage JSE TaxID=576789 RepID=C4MYL8_9CAUD|nr:hypothetical protein EpJSE_00050 [Escherichia phage JSE]ACL77999.1 hypothetical protein EpJSE_00050 [Escherichia phage JSE]
MKWEIGKTYTWKDENAKTEFITNGEGVLSPLNSDISAAIGDKPFTIIEIEGNGWIDAIELDGVYHTAKTATGKDIWTATYFFSPFDRKFFREVEEVPQKWEVGKTYTWKDANAMTDFCHYAENVSNLNYVIARAINYRPFTVKNVSPCGQIDVIEIDGKDHTLMSATEDSDHKGTSWFIDSDRKFFREVEELEVITTDSKIVGQLKRLFSSRYGLTMVKFGEANEGKTFERFDDFIAALDKMDEIMQDRQKIKDLQEDIKRREVEFLIGKERGW